MEIILAYYVGFLYKNGVNVFLLEKGNIQGWFVYV